MKPSLSNLLHIGIILLLTIAMWGGMFLIVEHLPRKAVYDCSIAEISPDIPPQVRQECRKIRMIKE